MNRATSNLSALRDRARRARRHRIESGLLVVAAPALMLWCLAITGVALGSEPRVVITRKPVMSGAAGCRAYGWIHNVDKDHHVAVVFRKTQHLFSGRHEQTLGVVLGPGERRALGCVSWPGAMRPTEYDVLDVWVYEPLRWSIEPSEPSRSGPPHDAEE